jgi:predicted acetyltransferase
VSDPFVIRRAVASDIQALAANHLRAYPYLPMSAHERAEKMRARSVDNIMVAEHEHKIIGQARTLALRAWLGGRETRVGGLAAVAVAPEARRGGVAVALCREHLQRLRADGTPWSMLYPFASTFYARLGWRPAGRKMVWRFPPRALPLYPDHWRIARLDPNEQADFEAIQSCHAARCALQNGSIARSDDFLKDLLGTAGRVHIVGVRRDGGGLDGYLLYEAQAPTMRPQVMLVHDLVAVDAAAERALLGFLAAQTDQFQQVVVETPVGHPLGAILDMGLPEDAEFAAQPGMGTMVQTIMARVVDLGAALVGRGYPGGDGQVAFAVTDRELPANDAPQTLVVAGGSLKVQPGRKAGVTQVRGDVGEVSRVLVGNLRLRDAASLNLVEVDGNLEAADALLALPVPYPTLTF